MHVTEGRGDGLEVGELLHHLLDHPLELLALDARDIITHALDLEAERGSEVLFVSEHDVDVLRDLAVDLPAFLSAAAVLPERGPVVEVIADHRTVLVGRLHGVDEHIGGGIGEGRVDSASVEPAHPLLAEETVPVDVTALEPARGGVRPIGDAQSTAYAEAALGEIETHPAVGADAVEGHPFDVRRIDAALENEVLEEQTDIVLGDGGNDRGIEPEALPQCPDDVVLTAALPHTELPRSLYPLVAGVEPEHDLSERNRVPSARGLRSDLQFSHEYCSSMVMVWTDPPGGSTLA